jgi:hypothetical protein
LSIFISQFFDNIKENFMLLIFRKCAIKLLDYRKGGLFMPTIRISKAKWGDVWFALLEVGPITRIPPANDYLYIVSQKHLETLSGDTTDLMDARGRISPRASI